MLDTQLVEASVLANIDQAFAAATVLRLTWAGCEFLDAARSPTLWDKAKKSVITPGASWTFDILKDWLKAEVREGFPTLR